MKTLTEVGHQNDEDFLKANVIITAMDAVMCMEIY